MLYPVTSNVQVKGVSSAVLGVKSYQDLIQHYKDLISKTTDFPEDNARNMNLLLWIHFVHSVQCRQYNDLLNLCGRVMSSGYQEENVLTALKCLSSLSNHGEPGLGNHCVKLVLEQILREQKNVDAPKFVLTSCMYTLCDWIMSDKQLLNENGLLKKITSIIMSFLTNDAESSTLKEAARYTLISLINNYGQWPSAPGNLTLSSSVTEESLSSVVTDFRYFCLEGVGFFTVGDRTDKPDTVTIILRDKKGRWVYDMTLAQTDDRATKASPPAMHPPSVEKVELADSPATDASRLVTVYSYFKEKNIQHSLISASPPPKAKYPPIAQKDLPQSFAPPARPLSRGQLFRLLLSNLGMLSLHQKDRFHAVNQTKEFYKDLKKLDLTSERECQRVGIVYVPSGVGTLAGTFMNKKVSPGYLKFLSSIGVGYNVKENKQNVYTGGAEDYGAEILPFHSTFSSETIFFPAHLLNCPLESKVKLMNTAHVVIIWCEDLDGYNPTLFPLNKGHIVINPLSMNGLFHTSFINFTKKTAFDSHQYAIGPITDKTVLSESLLVPMVRLTAANAYRSYHLPAQFNGRQTKIAKMIEEYSTPMTPAEFYSSLFKELPEGQLAPLTLTGVRSDAHDFSPRTRTFEADASPQKSPRRASSAKRPSDSSITPDSIPSPAKERVRVPRQSSSSIIIEDEEDGDSTTISERTDTRGTARNIPSTPPLPGGTLKSANKVVPSGSPPIPSGTPPLPSGGTKSAVKIGGGPPLPAGSPKVARHANPATNPKAPPQNNGNRPKLMKKTIRIAKDGAGRAKRVSTIGRGRGPPTDN